MELFKNRANFLNGPVGNNLANDPQDIKNTKKNLKRLGYLDDETENEFITRELDTAIKSFQKDNGLRVDGMLVPQGETEKKIEDQGTFVLMPRSQPKSSPEKSRPFTNNNFIIVEEKNDKQYKKGIMRLSQEEQTDHTDSVIAGYGTVSQNADATGKEMIGDAPPTPKKKPKKTIAPLAKKLDKKLLDLIGGLESSDNYNVVVGGEEKPLTNMTVKEVRQLQTDLKKQGSGSAVGRYQIIGDNMDYLIRRMDINENAVFDENMQDAMGKELLKRRGLQKFESGEMTADKFIENLSKEWAAIPKDKSNKSYWAGTGNNKAHTDFKTLKDLLQE